mgnify:CR=1 FL=1
MDYSVNMENADSRVDINNFDHMYHYMLRYPRTQLTSSFFKVDNIEYIIQRIEEQLFQKLNKHISVIATEQFFDNCANIIHNQTDYVHISGVLDNANNRIIKEESKTHYLSLRRRELFFKWFIFKDKPRVLTRSINTNGRHQQLSNHKYTIGHPDKSRFDDFNKYNRYRNNNGFRNYNPIFEDVLNSK